ncbi:Uncharacterized protein GBIM_04853 [Gryllus bimaculatus]|nr:Uncharacterized protein GBIM_04853 [Gryllus bimaculatus]
MRLTHSLWKQHLGRMAKKNWKAHGKKVLQESDELKNLEHLGLPVIDINEVVKDMKIVERVKEEEPKDLKHWVEPPPVMNNLHPLYKARQCYMHKNNTVLIGGLDQAKIIAKAVEVKDGLPKMLEEKIEQLNVADMHELVKRSILASHVFDAQQVKLPKLHDPSRPAWQFPRVYGISDQRRNYLLCEKLVQLCNSWSQKSSALFAVNNGRCLVPIEKEGDLIQFDLTLNMALLSSVPHEKFSSQEEEENIYKIDLPDIYPLKHTVSCEKTHFYESKDIFPVNKFSKFSHLHTIIIHHNETQIKNLHETKVLEGQLVGRCLLHGFAAAVSQARQLFGEVEKELPFPVSIQCIQTDGRLFDFSIFQLNTLDLNGSEGMKNMFWVLPRLELFSLCAYDEGRPTLQGYNPEVLKNFMAFCTH